VILPQIKWPPDPHYFLNLPSDNHLFMLTIQEGRLNQLQLDLLKSLRHVTDEQQAQEIKSLLNFYFEKKLELLIEKKEKEAGYTQAVYEQWLQGGKK
jgi:hypothetical protein